MNVRIAMSLAAWFALSVASAAEPPTLLRAGTARFCE